MTHTRDHRDYTNRRHVLKARHSHLASSHRPGIKGRAAISGLFIFLLLGLLPAHASSWAGSAQPRALNNGDKSCVVYSSKTSPRIDFLQIRKPSQKNHYVIVIRSDGIADDLKRGQINFIFPDGYQVSLPYLRSRTRGNPLTIETNAADHEDLLKRFGIGGTVKVSTGTFSQSHSGYGTADVPAFFEKCRRQL